MKPTYKPNGYNSLSPYLIVDDAKKLVELLKIIFDAKQQRKFDHEDGTIAHIELQLDDSVLMISNSTVMYPAHKTMLHLYVADVFKTFDLAVKNGCEIISNDKRNNQYLEAEAEVLNQLLEFWNIDQPILFGHSDGGSIALLTAAKYPSKIKAIITEGAHVFVEDVTIKGIKEAIHHYETTNLKAKLKKYHGENTEAMFWAWAKTWTTEEFSSWNIEQFLFDIQCPSLIIQGEKDEYGTLKQVESIVEKVSSTSEKFIIPNIGHTPHIETPEVVLKKVKLFVESLINYSQHTF